jgi:putative transposase
VALIEHEHDQDHDRLEAEAERLLPLSRQAELLSISRSSLYYRPVAPSQREITLKNRIDEIYTQYPFYGYRRIHQQLLRDGFALNRKTVQLYMRELGLQANYPGPNLSKRDLQHRVFPYLLKGLSITRPYQVFGTDITYIPLKGGWLYLVAIIDWYSRYVVSWELSDTLEEEFVLKAVGLALERGRPEILNSDQGSHFTSPQYTKMVLDAGVKVSMDGRGRALDNVFTERLWRSLKYESVYINEFESPKQARRLIAEYFEFYNNIRLHQALDYRTPAQVHFEQVIAVVG